MSCTTRRAIVSTSAVLSWPWPSAWPWITDPVCGSSRREDDAVYDVFPDKLESGGGRGGERLIMS